MKRPAFQFYPADWRKDPALSTCSLAARGLWVEMMCLAHESEEYGVLCINGSPMLPQQISRAVGESPAVVTKLIAELEHSAVFSRDHRGCIYSRRMVKDEHVRAVRAGAGRLGGNPNLLKQNSNQKDDGLDKQNAKQDPTPSSSSSSTSKTLTPKTSREEALREALVITTDGVDPASWERWIRYRFEISKPLKPASIPAAQRAMASFGSDQAGIVEQSIAQGWTGLFALKAGPRRPTPEHLTAVDHGPGGLI